jgi:hypothetical protein
MKGFILGVTLFLAGALFYGSGPAVAGGDLIGVQGYGGGGSGGSSYDNGYSGGGGKGYDNGYSRRDGDDNEEEVEAEDGNDDYNGGSYRERRYSRQEYGRSHDWCWRCARRCGDGWCPPRCYGWQRECRRGRY